MRGQHGMPSYRKPINPALKTTKKRLMELEAHTGAL